MFSSVKAIFLIFIIIYTGCNGLLEGTGGLFLHVGVSVHVCACVYVYDNPPS